MGKQVYSFNHPFFLMGKEAEIFFKEHRKNLENFPISDWKLLEWDSSTKTIIGSNLLELGVINYELQNSGIRVVNPLDDLEEVDPLIKGEHYSDLNAFAVGKNNPTNKRNIGLWRKINELAEKTSSVKPPYIILGYHILPNRNEKDYGIEIVPADNFKVISFEELREKLKGRKIVEGNNGLSGVFLSGDLYLNSGDEDLSYSNNMGRVIFIRTGEACSQR